MQWITRERPEIDRIVCPWLIQRFIDSDAPFFYVPEHEAFRMAEQTGGINFQDDHEMLAHGSMIYDAFYVWRQYVPAERHSRNLRSIVFAEP